MLYLTELLTIRVGLRRARLGFFPLQSTQRDILLSVSGFPKKFFSVSSIPDSTQGTKSKLLANVSSLKTINGYDFKQRSLTPN